MISTPTTPTAGATTGISTDTSRLKSKDNLDKAGQKFEAVFTGMMLKSMRQAKLSDPLFDLEGDRYLHRHAGWADRKGDGRAHAARHRQGDDGLSRQISIRY
ncbi:hypothetical protein [Sphingomonas sp. LR55]|uniref:hypothetical protein n=1 Tax=Sphingomonas sp. LR55 TaxID=3050231 RepID=UPI002FE06EA3